MRRFSFFSSDIEDYNFQQVLHKITHFYKIEISLKVGMFKSYKTSFLYTNRIKPNQTLRNLYKISNRFTVMIIPTN